MTVDLPCQTCGRRYEDPLKYCKLHQKFQCPGCLQASCVVNGSSETAVAVQRQYGEPEVKGGV